MSKLNREDAKTAKQAQRELRRPPRRLLCGLGVFAVQIIGARWANKIPGERWVLSR
jgi:hypothetical protein